jgi:hypothetical protein
MPATPRDPRYVVQTIVVPKALARTARAAVRLALKARPYARASVRGADETGTSWRFRQVDPADIEPGSFRTFKAHGPGSVDVALVYGRLKHGVPVPPHAAAHRSNGEVRDNPTAEVIRTQGPLYGARVVVEYIDADDRKQVRGGTYTHGYLLMLVRHDRGGDRYELSLAPAVFELRAQRWRLARGHYERLAVGDVRFGARSARYRLIGGAAALPRGAERTLEWLLAWYGHELAERRAGRGARPNPPRNAECVRLVREAGGLHPEEVCAEATASAYDAMHTASDGMRGAR